MPIYAQSIEPGERIPWFSVSTLDDEIIDTRSLIGAAAPNESGSRVCVVAFLATPHTYVKSLRNLGRASCCMSKRVSPYLRSTRMIRVRTRPTLWKGCAANETSTVGASRTELIPGSRRRKCSVHHAHQSSLSTVTNDWSTTAHSLQGPTIFSSKDRIC